MNPLRGTALYCGIGNTIEEMEAHLKAAASVGINAVFSSLQLPEADKEILLRDFPKMAEIAHRYGMVIDADLSERSADLFGLDLHDFAAFKKMGVDYARIDGGYTDEEIVAASHNTAGVVIELNAVLATDEWLEKLIKLGINKEQIHFCHNYYPMRYSGMTEENLRANNAVIHRHGFTVAGFIPSKVHPRMACSIGLPTAERWREMDTHTVIQEAFLFGLDDVYYGDDFADISELKLLCEADANVVTFRFHPFVEGKILDWLCGREMSQTYCGTPETVLRSGYTSHSYPGDVDDTFSCLRRRGDVTVCKSTLWLYSGEIQLVRQDLPRDKNIGIIGRLVDEDLPLLDSVGGDDVLPSERKHFRLVRDNK